MTDYNKGKVRYKVIPTQADSQALNDAHPASPDGYKLDDITHYGGTSIKFKTPLVDGQVDYFNVKNLNQFESGGQTAAYVDVLSASTNFRGEWTDGSEHPSSEDHLRSYFPGDIVSYTKTLPYDNYDSYQEKDHYICIKTNGHPMGSHVVTAPYNENNSARVHPVNDTNSSLFWKKIASGGVHPKRAFLGGVNEGYVPPYKHLWNALCGATPGTIRNVNLHTPGSGFTVPEGIPIGVSTATVTFTGSFEVEPKAVAQIDPTNGSVERIIITDPGKVSNYGQNITGTVTQTGATSASFNVEFNPESSIGIGDSVGSFITQEGSLGLPGNKHGNSTFAYINRRYGLYHGGHGAYGCVGAGHGYGSYQMPVASEAAFINVDYLDGVLPTPDGERPKIIQVEGCPSLGATLVLFNNGEVHYSGYNGNGEAGVDNTTSQETFVRCGYMRLGGTQSPDLRGKRAIRIASTMGSNKVGGWNSDYVNGTNYALIENPNGTRQIYGWGYNGYGQLAQDPSSTPSSHKPVLVPFDEQNNGKILDIWAAGEINGNLFVLSESSDGSRSRLWSCGYNAHGQLGRNSSTTANSEWYSLAEVEFDHNGSVENLDDINVLPQKFVVSSNGCYFMIVETIEASPKRKLYNWGYQWQGISGLGNSADYNLLVPKLVTTEGYTGWASPTTRTTSLTMVGSVMEDVQDIWTSSADYLSSNFISRGANVGVSTLLGTGFNYYNNLSLLGTPGSANNDTTHHYDTFQPVGINSGSVPTGVTRVCAPGGYYNNNYSPGPTFIKALKDPGISSTSYNWYLGGYVYGVGNGYIDENSARQELDPHNLSANRRAKNNILWNTPVDQNYIRVYASHYYSSGCAMYVDLRDGSCKWATDANIKHVISYPDGNTQYVQNNMPGM